MPAARMTALNAAMMLAIAAFGLPATHAAADKIEHKAEAHNFVHGAFVHGAPAEPSEAWSTAAGGHNHNKLHKIRNARPGAAMANMRALPLATSIDVLTYAATLPVK